MPNIFPTPFNLSNTRGVIGPVGPQGPNGPAGPTGPGGSTAHPTILDVTAAPYSADKTGVTSVNTAVVAAATAAGEGNGLYFPAGTYKFTGTWTLPALNQFIILSDTEGTTFQCDGTFNLVDGRSVKNLFMQGMLLNASAVNGGILGLRPGSHYTRTEQVRINSFNFAISEAPVTASVLVMNGPGAITNCTNGISIGNIRLFTDRMDFTGMNSSAIIISNSSNGRIGQGSFTGNGVADLTFSTTAFGYDWTGSGAGKDAGFLVNDNNGGNTPPLLGHDSTIASATTIAPTGRIELVSGTTEIDTITVPTNLASPNRPLTITLCFTGACPLGVSGNISRASTTVAGQAVTFTYIPNTSKWYY